MDARTHLHAIPLAIQSEFSHVFGVYSEPIEIALQYHLSHHPIRDESLYQYMEIYTYTKTTVRIRIKGAKSQQKPEKNLPSVLKTTSTVN